MAKSAATGRQLATIAHVIAGTVHNDTVSGARISVTENPHRPHGGVVIVYDADGNRTKVVMYEQMPRVEITYGEVGDVA